MCELTLGTVYSQNEALGTRISKGPTSIPSLLCRENTEGEYSGLEHEVVPDVVESLKVITSDKSRRYGPAQMECKD